MDKGPEEVRRDPLGGRRLDPDPLAGEQPGFDPATDAFRPEAVDPDFPAADAAETGPDEVEETRMEIEHTRADMSRTVDAIQDKLSPHNIKEQAKDMVREATVEKAKGTGSGIMESIRENPLPAALAGIGLGWLFMNARKQASSGPRYRGGGRAYTYYPPEYDDRFLHEERRTGGSSVGEGVSRTRDRVGESAGQAQEKAGELAHRTQEKAGELANRTQDQASRLSDQAQYQAERAGNGLQRIMRENPLAVGALAVGVGAAVGLSVPETGKENEVMGEARDAVVDKAQEKTQEVQQKAQRVAQEARSAAQQEVDNQGLTSS